MNSILKLLVLAAISSSLPLFAQGQPKPGDPFEEGMRQAFADYKKGDNDAVTLKLRELLKLMEGKAAQKVGLLLPDAVDAWKGESLVVDEAGSVVGGFSLSRSYTSGERKIAVKLVKDSPFIRELLPLFANEELIRMTNRKTHQIAGHTGIMEGENKLQIVVDERIYVELEGDKGTGETDLVAFASKLDLAALAKVK
jgi:hypothetical protein